MEIKVCLNWNPPLVVGVITTLIFGKFAQLSINSLQLVLLNTFALNDLQWEVDSEDSERLVCSLIGRRVTNLASVGTTINMRIYNQREQKGMAKSNITL